jgi:hypothetical protein
VTVYLLRQDHDGAHGDIEGVFASLASAERYAQNYTRAVKLNWQPCGVGKWIAENGRNHLWIVTDYEVTA